MVKDKNRDNLSTRDSQAKRKEIFALRVKVNLGKPPESHTCESKLIALRPNSITDIQTQSIILVKRFRSTYIRATDNPLSNHSESVQFHIKLDVKKKVRAINARAIHYGRSLSLSKGSGAFSRLCRLLVSVEVEVYSMLAHLTPKEKQSNPQLHDQQLG